MIDKALKITCDRLLSEISDDGSWRGYLSSSAVSTAVAGFALGRLVPGCDELSDACRWLADNLNPDGGWGDTPESPSNMTATLLARAALLLGAEHAGRPDALTESERWLTGKIGGVSPEAISQGVIETYGKDRTFSVPILTMCAISGMLGEETECWKKVPRLPFELAALPRELFSFLRLPVVSYAIPALIAVGLVHYRKTGSYGMGAIHNKMIIPWVLRKLEKMTPESGGFLEAAPLTGFVAMCLGAAGLEEHYVTRKAVSFLRSTMRSDGSWPIDTDLSSWLTFLASNVLSGADALSPEMQKKLTAIIRSRQSRHIHPFTGARPGGWGWANLSGSVPDGDDTSAALIALYELNPGRVTGEVIAGLEWLLKLKNRDGGMPTFCRGWGVLPFDRSCPDISAHAMRAFMLWQKHISNGLEQRLALAASELMRFLTVSRDEDGVWIPLWFGDQNAPNHHNRVYGTSVVLESIKDLPGAKFVTGKALDWLVQARNPDGGWGGEPGSPSTVEMSAKAISALALYPQTRDVAVEAAKQLAGVFIEHDGLPPASPIGLYFASLWYDEKLYPALFAIPAFSRCRENTD